MQVGISAESLPFYVFGGLQNILPTDCSAPLFSLSRYNHHLQANEATLKSKVKTMSKRKKSKTKASANRCIMRFAEAFLLVEARGIELL